VSPEWKKWQQDVHASWKKSQGWDESNKAWDARMREEEERQRQRQWATRPRGEW
jgi:hypothetical protein